MHKMRKYFPKFFVEIQLDCKAEDLSRLWDWDECIARAGISEASPFQGHIGEGGKKPKVTRAGMNKCVDLCRHLSNQAYIFRNSFMKAALKYSNLKVSE